MMRFSGFRTTVCQTAILLTFGIISPLCDAHAAFNPDTGTTTAAPTGLPDPSVIYSGTKSSAGYVSPLAPIAMPSQPLYPSRVDNAADAPAVAAVPAPATPAVDTAYAPVSVDTSTAATAPVAPAVITAAPNHAIATTSDQPTTGFIAPAPVLADNPLAQPIVTGSIPATAPPVIQTAAVPATPPAIQTSAAPAITTPSPTPVATQQAAQEVAVASTQKTSELSPQTRAILSHIPGNIDTDKSQGGHIALNRVSPEVKDALGTKGKVDSYESVGLSIKVRRPGLDENFELNRAYTALMGGDTDTAIQTYKDILASDPTSQDALFGLASTYHRLGDLDKARPLYGELLKLNPNHREGLNNFLVLVSDESPQDALPELERLETRNPQFSPIPAQIAVVLDKMGYTDEAHNKMLRAIELAPDNLTYKYNLAVMLDHHNQRADALALYKMLIDSSLHGQQIPTSVANLQKRVNYLTTALAQPVITPAVTASAAPVN